jgi:Tol biopolymer transport system component/C-terminal processing protease CtpA/Prc
MKGIQIPSKSFMVGAFALLFVANSFADSVVGARWLALSPDGTRLAFTYQGDIWVTSATGGKAVPLTDNVEMDDRPVWSPDGKQIAFASDRYGNNDVFVVDADGGRPKRVTYFTGSDIPSGWSADGQSILMVRRLDDAYRGVYSVNVKTGAMNEHFLDQMTIGDPQAFPEGDKVLYTRMGFPWQRARYQGSGASQLWVFDVKSGSRTVLEDNGFQHLWPQVNKNGIYAVTMREFVPSSSKLGQNIGRINFTSAGTPNVYSIDLRGNAKPLTKFAGDGVRFLTAAKNANVLAFERDGDVYTLEPGKEAKKIEITANLDEKITTEERMVLTEGISNATLSPDGTTVVFSAMNEIWSVPVKKGEGPNKDDATQWTDWAGIDDEPLYAPDGKSVFFISDRDGSERLYRLELESKKIQAVSTEDAQVTNLQFTPDRKFVAYQQFGAKGGIYKVPVDGSQPASIVFSRPGRASLEYNFSPDGKFVTFVEVLDGSGYYYWDAGNNVFVADTSTGKKTNLTQINADHHNPVFSPDGKYIYFTRSGGLFVIPLNPEDTRPNEIVMKFEKPKEAVKVSINFDDIETRIRRIANFNGAGIEFDREDGTFYFSSGDGVFKADYNGENVRRVTGPGAWSLTEDQKTMVVVQGGRVALVNLKAPGYPMTPVSFRADYVRDLTKTRQAAFAQFWRGFNNGFYDPNFHGRDWKALGEKYRKFLPSVSHRSEMSTILFMMVGELEASHSEVSPGPGGNRSQSSSHLGFSFDYSYAGPGIKIKEVPKRTPGSYAKSKLNPGEIVTKVNGKDVSLNESLYRDVLNDQVGREVTLSVKGTDGKSRDVKYRAITQGEYAGIVNGNRLEQNRKMVEAKSNQQLTYVHIAGMDGGSLDRFNQQVWQYAKGKKGLIIDVRGNGGGNTADRIIDILERKQNMNYIPRDESVFSGPGQVLDMPIVVMMDETSFSNAEMFPEAMRTRKLAKLVGRPTSGYVIYTYGLPLVDGTGARMPSTGVWRVDGRSMENDGVKPDFDVKISVEQFLAGEDPQLEKAIEVLLKGK